MGVEITGSPSANLNFHLFDVDIDEPCINHQVLQFSTVHEYPHFDSKMVVNVFEELKTISCARGRGGKTGWFYLCERGI